METKGRILITGMAEQPLENLTFRNIFMRVTGFESLERASQPRGAAHVTPVAQRVNHGPTPAAWVIANARGVTFDGFRVRWDSTEAADRHALYMAGVQQVLIRGFQGRPSPANGRLAAIGLDRTSDVFTTESKPDAGTAIFVGRNKGSDVTLSGNDLRHVQKEIAEGAVYVPAP
jgi:hypothetical protein